MTRNKFKNEKDLLTKVITAHLFKTIKAGTTMMFNNRNWSSTLWLVYPPIEYYIVSKNDDHEENITT